MATSSDPNTPFDSLSNPKRVWAGTPGSNEEGLGRLALLTPGVVAAAASTIKSGRRTCLSWDLTRLEIANFNRQPCQHHIISLLDGKAFDDVYIFNPRKCRSLPRLTVADFKYRAVQSMGWLTPLLPTFADP